MSAPARRRLLALVAALVLVTLVLTHVPLPAALAQPGRVPRVYVLRGGDAASDAAVVEALRARGLEVVSGVETPAFDGSQVRLRDFDVLVVLYTQNWQTPPLDAGLQAIASFVEQGGGLVTGEWFGWRGRLAALMPAINCGWNSAARTAYTLVAPHPAVNQDLPGSFAVNLANLSGSESCLQPRPAASVLYSSSNGGGRDGGGAGLVAWNYERGRVAQFSTLISATELASTEYRALFQNVVSWLATTRDTTPPAIREISAPGAGLLLAGREATLSFSASDSGGSGLGAYFILEQVFSGDLANAWTVARTSGWQPYRPPGVNLSWTLSDQPGMHYLQVYVADRAGNISRQPGVVLLNYRPALVPIGQDEVHIYRVTPGANRRTQVRMEVGAGNPDLYVFGPGVSFNPESDAAVEETSFVAQAGVYQVEVEGYQAGSYRLSLALDLAAPLAAPVDQPGGLERRPRISVLALNPPEPANNPGVLPGAPVEETLAGRSETIYLPILRQ